MSPLLPHSFTGLNTKSLLGVSKLRLKSSTTKELSGVVEIVYVLNEAVFMQVFTLSKLINHLKSELLLDVHYSSIELI